MVDAGARLAVVVPVYSGANYLEKLVVQLDQLRERWIKDDAPLKLTEVVLVDDASSDGSDVIIDTLSARYPFVIALHLSRNFGQHPATVAGILHTSTDWVVTMDEDLQHPPDKIDVLVAGAVGKSQDVVYAKPMGAVHRRGGRDASSRSFKWLVATISGNRNVPLFNSFRLMRGSVARATASICGHDTYFDMALDWYTQRVIGVAMELVDSRLIETGRSGYNFRRLLSHARRMLMSSGANIFRSGGILGLVALATSIAYAIVAFVQRIWLPETIGAAGWTSLIIVALFFGGMTTFLLGTSLEYLANLLLGQRGRPAFFVVDRSGDLKLRDYFKPAA